jgi:hypothetical protein
MALLYVVLPIFYPEKSDRNVARPGILSEARLATGLSGGLRSADAGRLATDRFDDRWVCWRIFEGASLLPICAPRGIRREVAISPSLSRCPVSQRGA